MTIQEIRNLTNATTFRKGMELYEEDYVYNLSVEENFIYSEVYSQTGYSTYEVQIKLNPRNGQYLHAYCECKAFATYSGPCKHCIAVLLEYSEYRDEYELDNRIENNLIEYGTIQKGFTVQPRETSTVFRDVLYPQKATLPNLITHRYEDGSIDIEPYIHDNYGQGVFVDFKIGEKQKYVIKDIFAFLDRFKYRETYKYGKKLEYTHTRESLTEQGRIYLDFINQWCIQNRGQYEKVSYTYVKYEMKLQLGYEEVKTLPLRGMLLENLLESVQSRRILSQFAYSDKQEIPIYIDEMKYAFYIKGVDEGIELSFDDVKIYEGERYYIFVDTDRIGMFDKSKIEKVIQVMHCAAKERDRTIFIANADVTAFCRNILGDLREVLREVSEGFDEKDYEYEPLKLKVYIDMPQKNMVTICPKACYGEEEYNIYNPTQDVEKRDLESEAIFAKSVNLYGNAYDNEHCAMVIYEDDNLLYHLLTEGVVKMQEEAEVYASDAIKALQPKYTPKVVLGVAVESGLLSLDVKVEHLTTEEMIEILSKYDKKKKYHRLKNGAFIQMEGSGLDEFSELQQALGLTDKQLKEGRIILPSYRTFFMDEQLKKGEQLQYSRNRAFKQLVRSMKSIEENDYEIPQYLESVLREYQKNGFLWLKTLRENGFGGILADDMGLGKTIQVIAFLASEMEEHKEGYSVLIVTPASLIYNWKSEIEKFAPQLQATMVVGTARERENIILNQSPSEILITSYDLLKRDVKSYEDKKFDVQIIDEAQYIKNAGTQATRAVKSVQSQFRLALTGTPVENRLSELWSIFDYILPGFLYNAKKFKDELETPIVKQSDAKRLERLKKMVTPFILRRRKQDVLKDLPDKVEENRVILLDKEQRKIYDAHVKRLQMSIGKQSETEFNTSKLQILAELTKLRQICCDPRLFLEQYKEESAKLEMCIQLIKNAVEGGHKILLFSQFTTMFEYIQEKLFEEGISFYTLTGATNKEKRAKMVQAFNTDDTSVFCISLKAGGTGLNLTAADIVIHYDPWWNVAVQDQATDRAHRIGQKQVVTVYKLIAKDTIEERIIALQEKKRALADQILEGDGVANASFSKEELMELLS